jgi:5-methylcytosine-specific restriction endonuclease McrA
MVMTFDEQEGLRLAVYDRDQWICQVCEVDDPDVMLEVVRLPDVPSTSYALQHLHTVCERCVRQHRLTPVLP